jgi:hypothetical protein
MRTWVLFIRCRFAFIRVTVQAVMTANTLYEAVEPQIVWKQLLTAILNELIGDGLRNEVRVAPLRMVPGAHFSVDTGSPFDSLHREDPACPRRRDSGRSLTNCIFRSLRSPAGWNPFSLTGPELTAVRVRFRSQAMQRGDPYQWCRTFCDSCMRLETRSLCLRFSNFLWMIHDQMPEAHWNLH